jgi:hypothetical protein
MTASLDVAAVNALVLFAQAEEHQREHLNPYLTGIGSFVFLTLCLALTLAFNRDR